MTEKEGILRHFVPQNDRKKGILRHFVPQNDKEKDAQNDKYGGYDKKVV